MNKKQAAVILIALVAVAGVATYVIYKGAPAAPADEFSAVDNMISELDEYLDFDNQYGDYDLDGVLGGLS